MEDFSGKKKVREGRSMRMNAESQLPPRLTSSARRRASGHVSDSEVS